MPPDTALTRLAAAEIDVREKPDSAQAHHEFGQCLAAAGRKTDALTAFANALTLRPDNLAYSLSYADLLADLGEGDRAIEIYTAAIERHDRDPLAPFNLGTVLAQLGRIDAAIDAYHLAIVRKPDLTAGYFNLGLMLHDQGDLAGAIESYRRTVDLQPGFAAAHGNLAMALKTTGALAESRIAFETALRLQPHQAALSHQFGNLLATLNEPANAETRYRHAIALKPGMAEAHLNLGVVLRTQSRPAEAATCLEHAISLRPDDALALANLADCRQDLGEFDVAAALYRQSIALRPDYVLAHNKLGVALLELNRHDEALPLFDHAISLQPLEPTAHLNRANALAELGQTAEAIESYEASLALDPNSPAAWCNLGIAYRDLQALDEAFGCYDRALALDPDFPAAHWNGALTRLLAGDFAAGLPGYEWRWRRRDAPKPRRDFAAAPWLGGEPIAGKTILLHAEQGFGDTLQFCRYASSLTAQGAQVILDVQPSLKALIARSFPDVLVIDSNDALPAFDRHCPLMSLPLAYGTDLSTIAATAPYLQPDETAVARWRRILGLTSAKRIGIAWAGSPGHKNDRHRSVPLAALGDLWAMPDTEWISLQRDIPERDVAALTANPALRRLGELLIDFDQTAALISTLDLVITVDTSIAHLAGALGKPVWLALPFVPDWRWLLDRQDSPWYPTATLFRQPAAGDWQSVVTAMVSFRHQLHNI